MDNPETLATLVTQDTIRRKKNTHITRKPKGSATRTQTKKKTGGEHKRSRRVSISCFLQDTRYVTHIVMSCRTPLCAI